MPPTDVDILSSRGPVANELLVRTKARMTLFTGSQAVAEKLTIDLQGRVKLEVSHFLTEALCCYNQSALYRDNNASVARRWLMNEEGRAREH